MYFIYKGGKRGWGERWWCWGGGLIRDEKKVQNERILIHLVYFLSEEVGKP